MRISRRRTPGTLKAAREILLAPGYSLDSCDLWLRNFNKTTLPAGAHVCYEARDGLSWLGKISHPPSSDAFSEASSDSPSDPSPDVSCIIRFLDDPSLLKTNLQPARYTTARNAISRFWCL